MAILGTGSSTTALIQILIFAVLTTGNKVGLRCEHNVIEGI